MIHLNKNKLHVVVVYAETLATYEHETTHCEDLYNQLDAVTDKEPKCDVVFVSSNFIAKVGSQRNESPNSSIGNYGKWQINNHGKTLLQLTTKQSLYNKQECFQT